MQQAEVIPTVSVDQMREVDRIMVEELHIELVQMMENAGRSLAEQARRMLGGDARGARVVALAGRGGNGGGGLTAGRRLSIWGADVSVILGAPRQQFEGVPLHQLGILDHLGITVRDGPSEGTVEEMLRSADIVLDALIGYSLVGVPREPIASLIRLANASGAPLLALDIPSGMNGDSGAAYDPTIRATATLTLALPKVGLTQPTAHDPTELNRQGPDVGTEYRSAIFPTNADQARIAQAYIDQLGGARVFHKPIVTRIEPDQTFFPAEAYHQDFLSRHPDEAYIQINDLPKIEQLKRLHPDVYRVDPVLVFAE